MRRGGTGRRGDVKEEGRLKARDDCVQTAKGKERTCSFAEVDYIFAIDMSFHIVPSNMTGAFSEG